MTDMGTKSLLQRAKVHLGLPPTASDTRIPPYYLPELEKLLELYPDGHNFRVTLHAGKGFGSLTCLQDNCGKVIFLKRRFGGDGGKKAGFGNFAAYRSHLADHELLPPAVSVKVEDDTTDSGSAALSFRADVKAQTSGKPTPSIALVQANAESPTHSRKRLCDVAFNEENRAGSSLVSQATKKLKTDAILKIPLATVTNHSAKVTFKEEEEKMQPLQLQNPVQTLEIVRTAIASQQANLDRVLAKRNPSKIDLLLRQDCEREVQRLLALERDCYRAATMQSSSSARPTSFELPFAESSTTPNVLPKKVVVAARPFPMDLDIKPSRFHLDYPKPAPMVGTQQGVAAEPYMGPRRSEPSILKPDPGTPNGVSTLKVPRPSAPAQLGPFRLVDSSDDEDSDGNNDGYEYDLPDASEFMNRIGMKAPAPILSGTDAIDDNGDYFGRGRDLYEGPRANPEDFASFLKNANAETFDGNVSVDKALERLGLKSLNDVLPGMEVTLMAHQAIGVAWMIDKELGVNKGGCLADEMGLGKTVQMIATMLRNRPTGSGPKTTLIVAPLALLDQWKNEIEDKTNCDLQCFVYHGGTKSTSKKKLLSYDVVLTTLGTLSREWPDYEAEMKKKKKAKKRGDDFIVSDDDDDMRDAGYRNNKRKEKAGLLFQVEFYRAILDEAQSIRNRRTRVSRAVVDLHATYRWCLTGTPIVNTLSDAYGYLRFLKIRPWYDWAEFHERIGKKEKKNPALAISRLHLIMNTFLLRRKKDTQLDGKLLIDLPEKEVKMVKLEFSKEERDIYNMVEARNQATFNRFLRAGTVLKQVLVLLLRLRQICSHASLIAEDANALVSPEEAKQGIKLVFSSELTRASRLVSEEFVLKMKEKLKEQAQARSADAAIDDDCPICFDFMTDAVITACGHVFCRECIVDVIQRKAPTEVGVENEGGCPCCRELLDIKKLFSRSAFESTDKELRGGSTEDSDIEMSDAEEADDDSDDDMDYYPKAKGKLSAHHRMGRRKTYLGSDEDEDDEMSDFIVESDEDEEEKDARRALRKRLGKKRATVILDSDDGPDTPEEKEVLLGVRRKQNLPAEALKLLPRFLPSSKMKYMMDQIQKLFKSKPDEKVMVVSQWTSCLTLVSDYLSEKGIPHVKYQGDMSRTKREQAVKVFMAKEKAKVMLMSLKSGGVGLNLTRANNVISLDLGWSQAIEAQAFDRVHRLGQKRKVLVQRVVIVDTVEDRILALQDRKQSLADGSLGEGSGKKMGRLSVTELANLFGLDSRGRRLHD